MSFLTPTRLLSSGEASERNIVLVIYFLFTSVALTGIFGPLIGLIIAYRQRKLISTELGKSHVESQIRSFWLSLLGISIGLVWFAILIFSSGRENDILVLVGIGIIVLSIFWFFAKAIYGLSKVFCAINA